MLLLFLVLIKKHILSSLSQVAPHSVEKSNTSNLQIPLRYEPLSSGIGENELFWQEIGEEIEYLAKTLEEVAPD